MKPWEIAWLACGLASIYPYYRFAIKPPTPKALARGQGETRWRDLDPVFFPLVTILMWPLALGTVALALWVQRLERLEREADANGVSSHQGPHQGTLLERLTGPPAR
jgi:hypothetical protein